MIQRLLVNAASTAPEHPAISILNRRISYDKLARDAASVASYFRDAGLRKGDSVILMWDNGPEYGALFFGILMAGGVVVPLNPANTVENVRYTATNCAARFIAANQRALPALCDWWKGGATLVSEKPETRDFIPLDVILAGGSGGSPEIRGGSTDDMAVVLYTSGTTGRPKGVVLTHRNLLANTRSILEYLPICASDRTLAILPFYYSYGNSLLLTHVSVGATLVVENRFAFVNEVLKTMQRERVTGFSGVPSHYSILLNRSKFLEMKWPDMKYLTCAGGGLPVVHVRKLQKYLPGVKIHLMYGQTEGAARLSSLDPDLVDSKAGSIGKGIPGVEIRVIDNDGISVRPGEIGELIACGENIMQGYLGDPEGTNEILKEGWLYTGDLATVDIDGYVYIKGRKKEFIKTGGYRISPLQIEEGLLQHSDISECAVVGLPDETLGECIVAYIIPRSNKNLDTLPESVMTLARKVLPHYMVPKKVILIDQLPKTDTGKVKRAQLKECAQVRGCN